MPEYVTLVYDLQLCRISKELNAGRSEEDRPTDLASHGTTSPNISVIHNLEVVSKWQLYEGSIHNSFGERTWWNGVPIFIISLHYHITTMQTQHLNMTLSTGVQHDEEGGKLECSNRNGDREWEWANSIDSLCLILFAHLLLLSWCCIRFLPSWYDGGWQGRERGYKDLKKISTGGRFFKANCQYNQAQSQMMSKKFPKFPQPQKPLENLWKPLETLETSISGNLCHFLRKPLRKIVSGNLWSFIFFNVNHSVQ